MRSLGMTLATLRHPEGAHFVARQNAWNQGVSADMDAQTGLEVLAHFFVCEQELRFLRMDFRI
jgi:hypothetical protein